MDLGWRMLPGPIQLRQSNTGLFGQGVATISEGQLVIKGRKLWPMWLRLLSFILIAVAVFVGVTLIFGIAAYGGFLKENPNDSSLVGSVAQAIGSGPALFLFILLPLLSAGIIAEVFLTKKSELRYTARSVLNIGRSKKRITLEVLPESAAKKTKRITIWFTDSAECEEFARLLG